MSLFNGYHFALSFADYSKASGVSKSAMDWFRKSPAHFNDFVHGRLVREDSKPLLWGRLLHALILEGRYDWVVSPFDNYRTKEAQAWRDEQTQPILTETEVCELRSYADAVREHAQAQTILADTKTEVSMFADDMDLEFKLKGRADAVGTDYFIDLKTVSDASKEGLSKAIYNYGWHRQAAFYLRIASLLNMPQADFYFIGLEKSNPPRVSVWKLAQDAIALGWEELNMDFMRLRQCRDRNQWHGYNQPGDEIEEIQLPAWAYARGANMPALNIGGESFQM